MSNYEKDTLEMRKIYSTTLKELIRDDKRVYCLEADLAEAITTGSIAEEYPDNFVNCGIMEANMVGMAAGLSHLGKIPYIHTFSPFATRRCYDQLYLSGAYSKTSVKVLGSDPGIAAQYNGGTHTSFEDVALMRSVPTARVMVASDAVMLKALMHLVKDHHGLDYISSIRKNACKLYNEGETFTIGKGKVLRDGTDAVIIAAGMMVAEALKAADVLKEEGFNIAVIDMFTIKPLDEELVITYAQKTGRVITAENHNIIGGLGSAVAEVLAEKTPGTLLRRLGVTDRFGQVGDGDFLMKEYHLCSSDIVAKTKELF